MDVVSSTKWKKKEKDCQKGKGGPEFGPGRPETPPIPHALSLPLERISLSLSHRRPTAWRHRRPSRFAGERSRPTSPTQRQPPKHHRIPFLTSHNRANSKPTRLNPQKPPPHAGIRSPTPDSASPVNLGVEFDPKYGETRPRHH